MTSHSNPVNPLGARGPQKTQKATKAQLKNGKSIVQARTALPLGQTVDAESLGNFGIIRGLLSKKERGKEKEEEVEVEEAVHSKKDIHFEKIEKIDKEAKEMAKKDPEFTASTLIQLHNSLTPQDTPEDILRKVLNVYADPTLADSTLAFLERMSKADLKTKIGQARALLNTRQGRDVKAGHNIKQPVKAFTQKHPEVKKEPNALRQLYRVIIDKEWTPALLFKTLFEKFSFEHLVFIFTFLFDALGADLKADGSSIPKPQLKKLVKDTKNIQAIFGVYRYFKTTEKSLKKQFQRFHIPYPEAAKKTKPPNTKGAA